jgi:adenylate cyclase
MTLRERHEHTQRHRPKRSADHRPCAQPRAPTWRTYVGITGLLVLLVAALVGGLIWFNAQKTQELMVADTERLMIETGEKVTDRIRLLFDPMYAIVGLGAQVSDLTAPLPQGGSDGPYPQLPVMLRGLKIYPQILSLYVGFENGDFFMVTQLAGEDASRLRTALNAPPKAAFANEVITTDVSGQRVVRWNYLAEDGSVIDTGKPGPASFDPRGRPWYGMAKSSDDTEHSGLYIFSSSGEPGFTLSRRFGTPARGVVGADIASSQIAQFLREQRITPSSSAFIFTTSGEAVAAPDETEMAAITKTVQPNAMIALPKIADLGNPLLSQVFTSYKTDRTAIYDVGGRSYAGRVIAIPPRYGEGQLLAVMVPLDEIEKPVIDARNAALFRSIVILLLVLPLYATLIVGWIDRRLGRRALADDDD